MTASNRSALSESSTNARGVPDTESLREDNRRLHGEVARLIEERNRLLRRLAEMPPSRTPPRSRVLEQRLAEIRAELAAAQQHGRGLEDKLTFLERQLAEVGPMAGQFLLRLEELVGLTSDSSPGSAPEGLEPRELGLRFEAAVEALWRRLDGAGLLELHALRQQASEARSLAETRRGELALLRERNARQGEELAQAGTALQEARDDVAARDKSLADLRARLQELEEESRRLARNNLALKAQVKDVPVGVDVVLPGGISSPGEARMNRLRAWLQQRRRHLLRAGLVFSTALAGGVVLGYAWLHPAPSPATLAAVPAPAVERTAPPAVAESPRKRSVPDRVAPSRMRDALGNGLLGPELVRLRGGRFTMGTDRYGAPAAERPARAVRVGPFAIGRFEVTFAQYDAFARASGRPLPDDEGWGRGDRPVINVSWNDARAYVRWLSRHSGRHYRLPTEAEWEYAYGAGASSLYWWGNGPVKGREVCLNCGTRWDGLRSAPVGSATANPQGLYDMGGNVMEWVQDCMAEKDEPGGGCATRVVRGGAFNKPDDAVHTTARRGLDPVQGYAMVGFRVVRD